MDASFDMPREELRALLEELHDKYNTPDFIEADPISVPHSFSAPLDREVAGFLAASSQKASDLSVEGCAKRVRHADRVGLDKIWGIVFVVKFLKQGA